MSIKGRSTQRKPKRNNTNLNEIENNDMIESIKKSKLVL